MINPCPCRRSVFRALLLCTICMLEASAAVAPGHSPSGFHWQALFTQKVMICGGAAVCLFLLSLLLRGLLKLISLVLVLVLAAGVFFFARDAWTHRSELLPPEWSVAAERTLHAPKAIAAWKAVQSEYSQLSADARRRIAAGADDVRRNLVRKLESKASELRKNGNTEASEELQRLSELLAAKK